ncbi:dipeptidase PepV [Lactobacillus terrae]|uniref:dipeptidase PepV n=1 Tax=Lactobacillus terrae TaxID=2269374 RepID=UPI000C1B6654|nr:dipeptidase PepV [Lactobacillus terrae]
MSIDWEKEVSLRSDELINDVSELVSINSQRDVEHKTSDYPLGPGPAKALKTFLGMAERDGFTTKNIENVAGRIEFGEGSEVIGILSHVDVVPEGPGWDTNPFEPTIKDGKLYARGASDDKGPGLAAYYGLKIIKELKLPVSKKIHFIIGTDEESDWVGINRYMELEEMPEVGFSPDAEFPAINGEKGIVSFEINFAGSDKGTVKSFDSGLRPNMVPQSATADIDLNKVQNDELSSKFEEFLNSNPSLKGTIESEGDVAHIELIGKASHAMAPFNGINAATYLAVFLNSLELADEEKVYFNFIEKQLHMDFAGKGIGIEASDEVMGELTVSASILKFDAKEGSIVINIRYPKGDDDKTLSSKIAATLPESGSVKLYGYNEMPHFVDANDPLVQNLVQAYRDHTGDVENNPYTIGGGTYGRILKKGIAFGAMFPGDENVMHQANEYIEIDKLLKAAAIYADAIYRLIK